MAKTVEELEIEVRHVTWEGPKLSIGLSGSRVKVEKILKSKIGFTVFSSHFLFFFASTMRECLWGDVSSDGLIWLTRLARGAT